MNSGHSSVFKLTIENIVSGLIIGVFIIYSSLSSPLPANLSVFEIIIFLLLVTIFCISYAKGGGLPISARTLSSYCILYITFIPTFLGIIIYQYEISDFLRDFIPLQFFLIPFFFFGLISRYSILWVNTLTNAFFISGVILSLRHISSGSSALFTDILVTNSVPLNQCPTVIFAGIYGFSAAFRERISLVKKVLFILGSLIVMGGLMVTVMRAQIAIVFLLSFFALCIGNKNIFKTLIYLAVALTIVFLAFSERILEAIYWTYDMILLKTEIAGLFNSRDLELSTVLANASASPSVFMFGSGWGDSMYVPTAGGIVRFTHNSLLYFLWKVGLIGCIAVAVYLWNQVGIKYIFKQKANFISNNFHLFFSVLGALFVYSFIEMGYKMMSFGFMLSFLLALLLSGRVGRTRD